MNTSPGEQIMLENGYSFLIVDGKCNYWAYPKGQTENSGHWNDTATGKLTAEQETSLKQDLSINDWHRWNQQTSAQDQASDMSTATFWTPTAVFHCNGTCGTASEREIQTNTRKTMQTLANIGESLTGPMRVTAVIVTDDMINQNSPPPFQPAPPEIDFPKHAISQETASQHCTDKTFEVSGPAATKLRQYREEFRTNQHGNFPTRPYLPLQTEDGTQYHVYARDSLPHEDANGLLQLEGLYARVCP